MLFPQQILGLLNSVFCVLLVSVQHQAVQNVGNVVTASLHMLECHQRQRHDVGTSIFCSIDDKTASVVEGKIVPLEPPILPITVGRRPSPLSNENEVEESQNLLTPSMAVIYSLILLRKKKIGGKMMRFQVQIFLPT